MKEKRLTSYRDRRFARAERDSQWAFMERVAREGVVWICPWDKYHKHKTDGVYVFGLIGSNEFLCWLRSHKTWWKRGPWVEKRCASSVRLTDTGRLVVATRPKEYDMEPIHGGMVEPGWVCTPLPPKKSTRKSKGCVCDPPRREDQIRTNPYCKAKHP